MTPDPLTPSQPEGTHVFLVLWKAWRALRDAAASSMRHLGLGDSEFRVLEALLHKGPLPVSVIGQKVDLTTGAITSAIDRLEQKGFVLRRNHAEDRRIREVDLTTRGRKLIEQAFARHRQDMESATAALSAQERVTLIELLKKLGKSATP